ncbi:MAG TPA: adenosylcobinamide-GDP ribazoletransferase, partial [Armatimonadota bacterium]|nr:adenosylcobinamide-GDP ribazoletransferase [Armatimonadota bacterium]
MRAIAGLGTAIRTLTILPFPGREASPMSESLYWFPLVGLIVGGLEFIGARGIAQLTEPDWAQGIAVLVVVLGAILTRGLHLDGLADWADGASVMSGREKMLEVMKDPRVGALGAVALIGVVFTKWVAVMRLAEGGAVLWVVGACVISRAMQVDLAASLPYARAGGGTAAWFVEDAGWGHRIVAVGGALLLAVAL